MTDRVVHFEIHAQDVPATVRFYTEVFGWTAEDWSEYTGTPYIGMTTGPDDTLGINGAVMQRQGDDPAVGGPVAGAVITLQVDDYDATARRILDAGGTVAMEKFALPGMAWQGYFHDPAHNVFGIHQPDPQAA